MTLNSNHVHTRVSVMLCRFKQQGRVEGAQAAGPDGSIDQHPRELTPSQPPEHCPLVASYRGSILHLLPEEVSMHLLSFQTMRVFVLAR